MRHRPEAVDERELGRLLASRWDLPAGRLDHLAVGFGDHHWVLADDTGQRWFVTVVDFDGGWRGTRRAEGLADLTAAMRTASVLAGQGLDFVLAPLPAAGGAEVASLDDRFAVTVFPYLDAQAGRYDDPGEPADRLALVDRLAALHSATGAVASLVPVRSPVPDSRARLTAALGQLATPWTGGPHGEPCRALLATHEPAIRRVLAKFDRLVRDVTAAATPLVVTHGEPHPGNILTGAGQTWLIDWDTVGLAVAERDLWRLAGPDLAVTDVPEFHRYAELTGNQVSSAAVELYKLRWAVDDLGLFTAEIMAEHEQTADTDLAWAAVREITEEFATDG